MKQIVMTYYVLTVKPFNFIKQIMIVKYRYGNMTNAAAPNAQNKIRKTLLY